MENKKVNLQNKGMSQDLSISKETPEYAFENHNIRIQATADNTLASVTNIQGPTKVSSIELEYFKNTQTVLFSEPKLNGTDYIVVHNLKYYGGSTYSSYTLNKTTDYYITGTVKTLDYSNQITGTLGRYTNKKILTNATLKYKGEVSHNTKVHLSDIDTLNDNAECIIGPVKFNTTIWSNNMNTPNIRVSSMDGVLLGACDCKDCIIAFTKANNYDYIYRIDINDTSYGKGIIPVRVLYKGRLKFKLGNPIESLFYLENQNIQKVYFVDGINSPRVINIITPKERTGTLYKDFSSYLEDTFSFYPSTKVIPKFSISKNYNSQSQLPAGVIQYFVSYYYLNGGETSIISASSVYDIDFTTRGAKADETGSCVFDITLSNIDTSFDYVRVYSAIRTSDLGPLQLHIVGDYELTKNAKNIKISFTDYGVNQEALEAQQLFFIGGTPLVASTLTEKDNTLFLGNLQSTPNIISESLYSAILKRNEFTFKVNSTNSIPIYFDYDNVYSTLAGYSILLKGLPPGYNKTLFKNNESKIVKLPADIVTKYNINRSNSKIVNSNAIDISFTNYHYKGSEKDYIQNIKNKYKCINSAKNQFSSYYDYARQTLAGHSLYKTFKGGEIYRFGIQFQNKYGQWTNAVWLGDKGCYYYPFRDEDNNRLMLNNAIYLIPNEIKSEALKAGFVNYRLLMANPEHSNGRKIAAQGVLCPTMFSPGQRALGSSWSIPSWIMRPRGFSCAYHHFEPTHPGYMNNGSTEIDGYYSIIKSGANKLKNEVASISAPYYTVDMDSADTPKYLVIQFCIHSGHKLAMKVTKVSSSNINNNFYQLSTDEFSIIKYQGCDMYKKDYGVNGWDKIYKDLVEWFNENALDIRFIPTPDVLKDLAVKQFWGEVFRFSTLRTLISTLSFDSAAKGDCLSDKQLLSMANMLSIGVDSTFTSDSSTNAKLFYGALATGTLPELIANSIANAIRNGAKNMKGITTLGFVATEATSFGNTEDKIPKDFAVADYPNPFDSNGQDSLNFIAIHPISTKSYLATEIESESKNFYVDESIVTLHSPEIENTENQKLNLRIVGYVPIDSLYADAEIFTSTPSFLLNGGYDPIRILNHRFLNKEELVKNPCGLYSDYLYIDNAVDSTGGSDSYPYMNIDKVNAWRVPLWASSGSLIGATTEVYSGKKSTDEKDKDSVYQFTKTNIPAQLLKKRFFNQLNSKNTVYFNSVQQCTYTDLSRIKVARPENTTTILNTENTNKIYNNIYDYLITRDNFRKLAWTESNTNNNDNVNIMDCGPLIKDTIRLKYSTTEHAVFDLCSSRKNYKELLPAFPIELKYNGVHTTFNSDTELWSYRKNTPIVDSCWTDGTNQYYDKGLLLPVFTCVRSPYEMPDNKEIITFNEGVNNLSESLKLEIVNAFKNEKNPLIILSENIITEGNISFVGLSESRLSIVENIVKKIIKSHAKKPLNENLDEHTKKLIEDLNQAFKPYENNFEHFSIHYQKVKLESIEYKVQNKEIVFTDIKIKKLSIEDYSDLIFKDTQTNIRWRVPGGKMILYKDFPIKYNQRTIPNWLSCNTPSQYLLMGELYTDIANNQLYGGYSDTNNAKLDWIPISNVTPLTDNILQSWGDTYYQRWDCLKTFPTTEDDINQVIDITSFMVESHINLDGRTDQNRGNFNIMSRPSNFNLMNTVYNSDTPFTYTLESNAELNTYKYPNQIAWSLSKNYGALVDNWTDINMLNISKTTYPITKLVNYNNQILALTEHSVDVVSFNNKNFVQTSSSESIELLNSGKVNGMMKLLSTYGTHNKSICITEKGLYFIDDNEKSLICIGSGETGIRKVGMTKLDSWFKNNIIPGTYSFNNQDAFHLEYDAIYKDLYIVNKNTCLIYNENLDSFTSFIDFEDTNFLYNNAGELYSIAHLQSPIIYQMYNGGYNTTYDSKPINYSVEYRVNPEPFSDKVFSNVEFIADLGVSTTTPNKDTSKVSTKPFDTIHVWNEFQDTLGQPLTFNRNYVSNLQQKFRIWRADIPRDYNSPFHRDRIRNPWIHLKLEKDNITTKNTDKMQLHSMNVGYMI